MQALLTAKVPLILTGKVDVGFGFGHGPLETMAARGVLTVLFGSDIPRIAQLWFRRISMRINQ